MTRGPQYRTRWETEPYEYGFVVTASLDNWRISKAFTRQELLFDGACQRLTRMQRQLNTVWNMNNADRPNII